jgi:hypothetical protein
MAGEHSKVNRLGNKLLVGNRSLRTELFKWTTEKLLHFSITYLSLSFGKRALWRDRSIGANN